MLSLGTCALTLILAVPVTVKHQRIHVLALAASATQALLLCTLSHLFVRYCLKASRSTSTNPSERGERRTFFTVTLGIVPSLVAGSLVGATFVWCKTSPAQQPKKIIGTTNETFLLISLTVWTCSLLGQVIFYTCLMWVRKSQNASTYPANPVVRTFPEMMEESQPLDSITQPNSIHNLPIATSSPPSITTSEETGSLRSSLSTIQRPTSSKTRLLIRQHSFPRQSKRFLDHPAPSISPHEGGFDSWDTSAVAPHMRETVLQSSPVVRGKPLEPIPGSRSPSPATALEGPFYPQSESLSAPPSPLPQPSYSTLSYQPQANPNEEDIHPLFRSCSPIPPPTASSNTVLTAAPGAGQLIDGGMLKRMRSGSLPTKPSPLFRTDSFDNPSSPRSAISASQEFSFSMPEAQSPTVVVPHAVT